MALMIPADAGATPPPIPQQIANCQEPTYASDMLVCSDAGLKSLDAELSAALAKTGATPNFNVEPQTDWFSRSRRCASRPDHRVCLRAAYRERIAIVGAFAELEADDVAWRAARCGGHDAAIATLSRGVLAVRAAGAVSLAMTATELAIWRPYGWGAWSGRSLRLTWLSGEKLRCDLSPSA